MKTITKREYVVTLKNNVFNQWGAIWKEKGGKLVLNEDEINCLWRNGDLEELRQPLKMEDIEPIIVSREITTIEREVKFCYD